mmetsp:Transcript_147231/g.257193  ORF Transcript_147231/g.257193 Transcript_147231/m.257193 type:complete len:346 (-) Transcript_147231:1809-2846(-)
MGLEYGQVLADDVRVPAQHELVELRDRTLGYYMVWGLSEPDLQHRRQRGAHKVQHAQEVHGPPFVGGAGDAPAPPRREREDAPPLQAVPPDLLGPLGVQLVGLVEEDVGQLEVLEEVNGDRTPPGPVPVRDSPEGRVIDEQAAVGQHLRPPHLLVGLPEGPLELRLLRGPLQGLRLDPRPGIVEGGLGVPAPAGVPPGGGAGVAHRRRQAGDGGLVGLSGAVPLGAHGDHALRLHPVPARPRLREPLVPLHQPVRNDGHRRDDQLLRTAGRRALGAVHLQVLQAGERLAHPTVVAQEAAAMGLLGLPHPSHSPALVRHHGGVEPLAGWGRGGVGPRRQQNACARS